MKSQKSR